MDHYLRAGAYYPKGGGQVFAAHLVDVLRSNGGELRTRVRVERILVEDGHVQGVRLTTGEELFAPIVVSNADLKRTYLELLGEEGTEARAVEHSSVRST
jgi:phytoene dehydrogenase-like protein